MNSCVYTGRVAHVRRSPTAHRFRYRIALAYLDLDETADLLRSSWWASAAPFAPLSFCAADHADGFAPIATPADLATAARALVAHAGGPGGDLGAVRLLTPLRHWGAYFSPLSLYYCFDRSGDRIAAIVAEVSNTPWNERRRYVLLAPPGRTNSSDAEQPGAEVRGVNAGAALRFRHAKDFHVSPFMGMEAQYDWRITAPGHALRVHLRCTQAGQQPFDAALALVRKPWSERALAGLACRFPAANLQVLAAIYWQAFRLWMKQCPYYPHPDVARRA
jgi:DUF1365 family protein